MSLRRAAPPAPAPAPAPAPLEAQLPTTIAGALGIDKFSQVTLPKRFVPQYPTPQPVGNVVDDAFDGYNAAPVAMGGLFSKKPPKDGVAAKEAKPGGVMAGLQKAKALADKAVLKVNKGVKKASDKLSGLDHFDYKLYADNFTALLGVAKKTDNGKTNEKYNYQAFSGDAKLESARMLAVKQEASMTRTESQETHKRGMADKKISRQIKGRNAGCLGFADVVPSPISQERYGDRVYPVEGSKKGDATIVSFTHRDTNGADAAGKPITGMKPISGLVIEALDVDNIAKDEAGNVLIDMADVPKIEPASTQTLDSDGIEFLYGLCVHGIHVDETKEFFMSPRIFIPKNKADMKNVAKYGIGTEKGVESALSHAMQNKKIDLLLLWTIHKLVLGAQGISKTGIDKEQRAAAQELFGSLDDMATQNSFGAALGGDEFATMNRASIV